MKRTAYWAGPRSCIGVLGLTVSSLVTVLLIASPVFAATVTTDRPLLFRFDGSESSVGFFTAPLAIAANELTGDVYVINAAGAGKGPGVFDKERAICRFNAEGEAENFSALGESCLDGSQKPDNASFGVEGFFSSGAFRSDIAVDNSAVNPGRIYVSEEGGSVHAFSPDGSYLWTLPQNTARPCGIAVDAEGHLWVGNGYGSGITGSEVLEFASTGSPPAQIGSFQTTNSSKLPCRLAVDMGGQGVYVGLEGGGSGLDKYFKKSYDTTLSTSSPFDVTVDQSKLDGHIFAINSTNFSEYKPCESVHCPVNEVPGSPFGHDLIGSARGVAFNPMKDWVYVSDKASNTVKVFGPVTTGTAPDVGTQPSEPVGLHSATAHGTINPLGLPASYHFEWKPCESIECSSSNDANWGAAQSSEAGAVEPADSSSHSVSEEITEYHGKRLRSNTWFEVRLAGTNPENHLSAYATADTFKTLAPLPATIESCSISAVAAESAHIGCTIDPHEDETSWQVLSTPLPNATKGKCEALGNAEFKIVREGTDPGESPGTIEVQTDLEGLLPAQAYCVRVTAANPGGGDSEDAGFSTLAIPPGEASAVFAAPRTDTTARINGRVNPNGEAAITGGITYRFEVSVDGVNWTLRPILKSNIDAREPIVLSDDLSGLDPATTYHYRFGMVQSQGGPAISLGGEKTFTTRSEAEVKEADPSICPENADVRAAQHTAYLGSCRGIELVNEPDKGNQNIISDAPPVGVSPMSADGDKVLWRVAGGAPGGPNGANSAFLAQRSDEGWRSQSVAPPAEEQYGGGALAYFLNAVSPDFKSFVFGATGTSALSSPPAPTVVRVREGQQDVLKAYTGQPPTKVWEESLDLSDDGQHVLFMDAQTNQLEDIGGARVGPPAAESETVSIMPDGLPSECGLDAFGGSSFGVAAHPGYHWIGTNDASRVYFRTKPNKDESGGGSCSSAPMGLYVRNRESGTGTTTLLDPGGPHFLRATPDGRHAYFVSDSALDSADKDASGDVYRWDEEAGKSTCLTCGIEDGGNIVEAPAGVVGALVSNDFSHVYFTSKEQLVAGEGQSGSLSLYVLSDKKIRFITAVNTEVLAHEAFSELSNDGSVLLFKTEATPAMTADATAPQCVEPQGPTDKCIEVYRYDERDGSLECLSCNHLGITTNSVGSTYGGDLFDFRLAGDGGTVAFATSEGLISADVNHGTDIYEWRNGTRHLITNGVSVFQTGVSAPRVIAADSEGSNILFALVPPGGSLTGFEGDRVANLYDARVGGGFEPPPLPKVCEGDSCQGPLQPPPAVGQTASTGVSAGNIKRHPRKTRCPKGKSRRHGRCLRHPKRSAHVKQRRSK